MEEYRKIKTVNRLSKTMQEILHLINEFGKLHNLKEDVRVDSVDDQLQNQKMTLVESFKFVFFCKLIQP